MNIEMLKAFKEGERINQGTLFGFTPDDEIEWECIGAGEGHGDYETVDRPISWRQFRLTFFDVEIGRVMGVECDGDVDWVAS